LAQTPLPQSVVLPPQLAVQWLWSQTSPLGQAAPQAPQLAGSVRRSAHWPLHTVVCGGHAHAPALQI
jgi:hypothetical protein